MILLLQTTVAAQLWRGSRRQRRRPLLRGSSLKVRRLRRHLSHVTRHTVSGIGYDSSVPSFDYVEAAKTMLHQVRILLRACAWLIPPL